jgi:hypothetical protein
MDFGQSLPCLVSTVSNRNTPSPARACCRARDAWPSSNMAQMRTRLARICASEAAETTTSEALPSPLEARVRRDELPRVAALLDVAPEARAVREDGL